MKRVCRVGDKNQCIYNISPTILPPLIFFFKFRSTGRYLGA